MSFRLLAVMLGCFALIRTSHGHIYAQSIDASVAKKDPKQYTCTIYLESLGLSPAFSSASISGKDNQAFSNYNSWNQFNVTNDNLRMVYSSWSFNGYKSPKDCHGACEWCFNRAAALNAVEADCWHTPGPKTGTDALQCQSIYTAVDYQLSIDFQAWPDVSSPAGNLTFLVGDAATIDELAFCNVANVSQPLPSTIISCQPPTYFFNIIQGQLPNLVLNISHAVQQPDGTVAIKTVTFDNTTTPLFQGSDAVDYEYDFGVNSLVPAAPGVQGDPLQTFG